MSLHRSLKTKSGALNQHRNVLTRAERIAKLTQEDRFDASKQSALGLVKVRSIKVAAGKKPKKAEAEGAEGAAKPAAGGKAPAAAAKAPAAKAAAPKK
jgi:small basic protein (TIGR04137 family)